MKLVATEFDTPIGPMTAAVSACDGALVQLSFGGQSSRQRLAAQLRSRGFDVSWNEQGAPAVRQQIGGYFRGELVDFDLPLRADGTAFQRRVWQELRLIPYGETATYGEIAKRVGNPRACRAVGRANAENPIAVVVPCHRVIGADGTLTGYAGGLSFKQKLLEHERRVAAGTE